MASFPEPASTLDRPCEIVTGRWLLPVVLSVTYGYVSHFGSRLTV